ncbi:hypothetical protein QZM82_13260 [Burkholderia cepacia]|uniref:hypothetical protein n=1 Tax=Burkholderia cepacia TaxID=292 RepID=UPI0026563AA4|nr:hypothetical protein [Burkholderia cepacia]MDN7897159.1 hypothetical protein [Burkholderia cepacia]
MARLTDLLDEDQFGNIESIVKEAGVEPPALAAEAAASPAAEAVAWVWCDTIHSEHCHSTDAEAIEEGWIPLVYGDPKAVQIADEKRSKIEAAIKATEYKYFGSYEFTESQHDAVDVLVDAARTLLAAPHIAPQPAQADAPAEAREPDGWQYRERVNGQWTEWKSCGKTAVERYQHASDLQFMPIYRGANYRTPADAGEAAPFGWAQPKGGNYFTRNESSAKRIGGLVPVYTAAPTARVASLTDEQWYDLASRHANANWNSDGYLAAVKALCGDYFALLNGADQ